MGNLNYDFIYGMAKSDAVTIIETAWCDCFNNRGASAEDCSDNVLHARNAMEEIKKYGLNLNFFETDSGSLSRPQKTVPEMLEASATTYRERNKFYGNNYKNFGEWVSRLFPEGVTVKTPEEWNRMGVLIQKLSKLSRYAEQYEKGGHDDSLLDDVVYTTMLRELDSQIGEKT